MKKKYGPWKVGIECDYSAWRIYRRVSTPQEDRRQFRPERFLNLSEAIATAKELNRQK